MHARDDAVSGQHQIGTRRRRDDGGVIFEAECSRRRRERAEVARDQALFGRKVIARRHRLTTGEFSRA
jgi:hypothetical protein